MRFAPPSSLIECNEGTGDRPLFVCFNFCVCHFHPMEIELIEKNGNGVRNHYVTADIDYVPTDAGIRAAFGYNFRETIENVFAWRESRKTPGKWISRKLRKLSPSLGLSLSKRGEQVAKAKSENF